MSVLSLSKVDDMREIAATFAARSRNPEFDPLYYRICLQQIELEIEAAIIERLRHPPCPLCPGGVMVPNSRGTPTCVDCGGIALRNYVLSFPPPDPLLDLGDEGDRAPPAEECGCSTGHRPDCRWSRPLPTDRGEP